MEIYGFGNEDSIKALLKKQAKDKKISEKMRQIDKSQLVDNDFNKEMFFSDTFSHQKDEHYVPQEKKTDN